MEPSSAPPLNVGLKGRGAAENPTGRFEPLALVPCLEDFEHDPTAAADPAPPTRYFKDPSRSILSRNESPDVPFELGLNPYRGCEHGCIYCYARPTHEYLGLSAGLDFETRILVKTDAPRLLRRALASPRYRPQVIALSGVTDAYQPIERQARITRGCLEVLCEFRNPVTIITKSSGVARDIDLLAELARFDAATVHVSITTLDRGLARLMEPRAPTPRRRLELVRELADAGIPVGVMVAPVVPGLTDHEIPRLVEAAARAGASSVRHIILRLPHGLGSLFEAWLERHFPDRKSKVLNRIRAIRGGPLNDPRFGQRMRGSGPFADQIETLFALARRRCGLPREAPALSTRAFRRPGSGQLALFEDAP